MALPFRSQCRAEQLQTACKLATKDATQAEPEERGATPSTRHLPRLAVPGLGECKARRAG